MSLFLLFCFWAQQYPGCFFFYDLAELYWRHLLRGGFWEGEEVGGDNFGVSLFSLFFVLVHLQPIIILLCFLCRWYEEKKRRDRQQNNEKNIYPFISPTYQADQKGRTNRKYVFLPPWRNLGFVFPFFARAVFFSHAWVLNRKFPNLKAAKGKDRRPFFRPNINLCGERVLKIVLENS